MLLEWSRRCVRTCRGPWEQIGAILELLRGDEGGKGMFQSYPVVAALDSMAFLGTISRRDLVSERGLREYLMCVVFASSVRRSS